jgi:hypothetical protein
VDTILHLYTPNTQIIPGVDGAPEGSPESFPRWEEGTIWRQKCNNSVILTFDEISNLLPQRDICNSCVEISMAENTPQVVEPPHL